MFQTKEKVRELFGKESCLPSYFLNIMVLYAYRHMCGFDLGKQSIEKGKQFSKKHFCVFVLNALKTVCKTILDVHSNKSSRLGVQYPFGKQTTYIKIKNMKHLFSLFPKVESELIKVCTRKPVKGTLLFLVIS